MSWYLWGGSDPLSDINQLSTEDQADIPWLAKQTLLHNWITCRKDTWTVVLSRQQTSCLCQGRKTYESAFRKDLTSETIPTKKTRQRRRNVHGCTGTRNVRKTLNFLSRSSRITQNVMSAITSVAGSDGFFLCKFSRKEFFKRLDHFGWRGLKLSKYSADALMAT